jgi:hypothetical protein
MEPPPHNDQVNSAGDSTMQHPFETIQAKDISAAHISTIPCEIQLEILYYLLLSAARRVLHPERKMMISDLNGMCWPNNITAAIATELDSYLLASLSARSCWHGNQALVLGRVARQIRLQTSGHLEAQQRQRVRARLAFLLWTTVADRVHTSRAAIRAIKAEVAFLTASQYYCAELGRDKILIELGCGE